MEMRINELTQTAPAEAARRQKRTEHLNLFWQAILMMRDFRRK